jgi:thioredoxin 1
MPAQLTVWMEKDFNEALEAKHISVVEFGAPWCAACKATEPIVAEIAKDFPDIKFSKINVAENPQLASKMGVMSLPNILIISNGKVVDQIIGGANRAKIEEKIRKII